MNSLEYRPIRIKLVVVGDDTVGKTCLFWSYTKEEFPHRYVPTIFEGYVADHAVDGKNYDIALWDTVADKQYERLRPLSYPDTDVILLCFSLVDKTTLTSVSEKWYPELDRYCPGVPIVLVGTKLDLRDDKEYTEKSHNQSVSMEEAMTVKELNKNVVAYVECSSLTQQGVKTVFETAARATRVNSRSTKCVIS